MQKSKSILSNTKNGYYTLMGMVFSTLDCFDKGDAFLLEEMKYNVLDATFKNLETLVSSVVDSHTKRGVLEISLNEDKVRLRVHRLDGIPFSWKELSSEFVDSKAAGLVVSVFIQSTKCQASRLFLKEDLPFAKTVGSLLVRK